MPNPSVTLNIIKEQIANIDYDSVNFSDDDNKLVMNIFLMTETKFPDTEKLINIKKMIKDKQDVNQFFIPLLEVIDGTLKDTALIQHEDSIKKIVINPNDPDSIDNTIRNYILKVLEQVNMQVVFNVTTDQYYTIQSGNEKIKIQFNNPLIPQFNSKNSQFMFKWRVLLDRIGGGNFGSVYKQGATYILKGNNETRELIIKKSEHVKNPKVYKTLIQSGDDFSHEMNMMMLLGKRIYPTDTKNTSFSMDAIKGDPISKLRNLTVNEYFMLFESSLKTLNDFHQKGFTHNDLHPGNLIFDRENGKVSLIDFGHTKFYTMPNTKEIMSDNASLATVLLSVLAPVMAKELYESPELAQSLLTDEDINIFKSKFINESSKNTANKVWTENDNRLDSILRLTINIYTHQGSYSEWMSQISLIYSQNQSPATGIIRKSK